MHISAALLGKLPTLFSNKYYKKYLYLLFIKTEMEKEHHSVCHSCLRRDSGILKVGGLGCFINVLLEIEIKVVYYKKEKNI